MSDENLILLLDVLDKLGNNEQGADTKTVFQWLAEISGDTSRVKRLVDAAEVEPRTIADIERLLGDADPDSGLTTVFKGLKLITDYVDNLEAKIGLNTDNAGTGTVFARLTQIAGDTDQVKRLMDVAEVEPRTIADIERLLGDADPDSGLTTVFKGLKLIADYVDTLEAKIGLNNDDAGAGTVFARLAQIAGDTAQVKRLVDAAEVEPRSIADVERLLGDPDPDSGLTTVFKGLKLIADYVDTLESKIGPNTDGAGTNTVFAKLAQIEGYTDQVKQYLNGRLLGLGHSERVPVFSRGSYGGTYEGDIEVISVPGPRLILGGTIFWYQGSYCLDQYLKILRDGSVLFHAKNTCSLRQAYSTFGDIEAFIPSYYTPEQGGPGEPGGWWIPIPFGINFQSKFIVQFGGPYGYIPIKCAVALWHVPV